MDQMLAQEYLRELHVVRQVSPHTINAYEKDLKILFEKLQESHTEIAKLTSDQVRSWVGRLHSQGLAPRSIARTLSAWRGFYLWLANQKKLIAHNPLDDIKAPKRLKPLPKALSVEGAINLLESAAKKDIQEEKIDIQEENIRPTIFEEFYERVMSLKPITNNTKSLIETASNTTSGSILSSPQPSPMPPHSRSQNGSIDSQFFGINITTGRIIYSPRPIKRI